MQDFSRYNPKYPTQQTQPEGPNKKRKIVVGIGLTILMAIPFVLYLVTTQEEPKQDETKTSSTEVVTSRDAFVSETLESTTGVRETRSSEEPEEPKEDPDGLTQKGEYTQAEAESKVLDEYNIDRARTEEIDFTKKRVMLLFPRGYDLSKVLALLTQLQESGIEPYIGIYEREMDYQILLQQYSKYSYEASSGLLRGFYYDGKAITLTTQKDQDPLDFLKGLIE